MAVNTCAVTGLLTAATAALAIAAYATAFVWAFGVGVAMGIDFMCALGASV